MYTRSGEESVKYANSDDFELQLDLDTEEQEQQYRKMLPAVRDVYPVEYVVETPSKSGNTHVRIYTAYLLSVEERIALQAILGSDLKKELCSLRRWLANDPLPILLFEKGEN